MPVSAPGVVNQPMLAPRRTRRRPVVSELALLSNCSMPQEQMNQLASGIISRRVPELRSAGTREPGRWAGNIALD